MRVTPRHAFSVVIAATTFAGGGPAALAVEFSALHGSWQGSHTPCGSAPSDDWWTISSRQVRAMESTCKIISASKKRDVYTLKMRCEGSDNEKWNSRQAFRLIDASEMETDGRRYRRCK